MVVCLRLGVDGEYLLLVEIRNHGIRSVLVRKFYLRNDAWCLSCDPTACNDPAHGRHGTLDISDCCSGSEVPSHNNEGPCGTADADATTGGGICAAAERCLIAVRGFEI
jgi:hypothetical protein